MKIKKTDQKYIFLFGVSLLLFFFLYKRDFSNIFEFMENPEDKMIEPSFTENKDVDIKRIKINQKRFEIDFDAIKKEYVKYQENKDYIDDNDDTKIDKNKRKALLKAVSSMHDRSIRLYEILYYIERDYDEFSSKRYIGIQNKEEKDMMKKSIGLYILKGNGVELEKMLTDLSNYDREESDRTTIRAINKLNQKLSDQTITDQPDYMSKLSTNKISASTSKGLYGYTFHGLNQVLHEFIKVEYDDPTKNPDGENNPPPVTGLDNSTITTAFNTKGNTNAVKGQ